MWRGQVTFGDGWAVYAGDAADQALHAHAALQVAIATSGSLAISLADGATLSGDALVVAPLVRHRLLPTEHEVILIYLDAQTELARRLLDALSPATIGTLPDGYCKAFGRDAGRMPAILSTIDNPAPRDPIDARLAAALTALAEDTHVGAIERAAKVAGLSAPRLRALAKEQLGLPLSQWQLWRKLANASRAIAAGESLAKAALSGSFADQAHLARTMRRMFGVSLGETVTPLRRTHQG